MKTLRKTIAVILSAIMIFACCGNAAAADMTKEVWDTRWAEDTKEISAAVTMFPGSDENDRNIAWYSASEDGYALLSGINGTEKITAASKETAQGDYRLSVSFTDLAEGEYTYKCVSGDFESETYSFSVKSADTFTAMYVTDIHVGEDDEDVFAVRDSAFKTNETFATAYNKAQQTGDGLDLIISSGDQASLGLRSEYAGLSSNVYTKSIPFATSIGNHDRKSVDYKYYTNLPNESEIINFKSYIGTDYWFRQGDVLFLMFDSNNTSMAGHRYFAKQAVRENKDCKWRVAVFHHDLYGGRIPHRESENALLRLLWAPMADEFGFDLCLLGHSHYYTMSNVLYNNKTVESIAGKDSVTDPKGTIFMVSGSLNNPRDDTDEEGNEPPVGENIGYSYLTTEMIYNLLEFSGDSITIKSYTVESDELINTFTINKTSKEGGHKYRTAMSLLNPLVHFITRIVNVINNIGMYQDYKDQGHDVPFFEGLIG
ncbi:MAG: metallophosphoesterase [Clostridia bacterium]|nr:metallophosphoesterase [Clostridia bacterium]